MSYISAIETLDGNSYDLTDGQAIANITRSGDTFTATKRDGTSFTFTQGHQDISGKLSTSLKGANNGLAELDANGKVPTSQLPSYVDDVLEYNGTSSFPTTGETGKIYVDTSTNKTYRWGGSSYVEISPSLALGETSSTAYRGDRGKTAYDHSQKTSGNPHNVTKSDVGLGDVGNFKAVSTVASQGLSSTEQSNARANIGAGTSSFSGSYNDLSNKPTIPTLSDATNSTSSTVAASSKAVKTAYDLAASKTSNVGTITGITMNGSSKGTSGVVDLGTVITAHQDISGKADKSATVSTVAWDSTNKKLTKTINGTTSDVVTGATILGGLTKAQVTTALGYTPPATDTNTTYTLTQNSTDGHKITFTPSSGTATTITIPDNNTTYSVMSVEEGTTGTATDSRVLNAANLKEIISDKLEQRAVVSFYDLPSILSDVVRDSDLSDGAYVNAPRYVNLGSISSLPGTWTVTGITTDMVCSEAILSNPAAQTGDWTVNTNTANQITLSGSISGTTTVTLVMVPSISITGVKK